MKKKDYIEEVIKLHLEKKLGSDKIAEKLKKKYKFDISEASLARKFRVWLEKAGYGKGAKLEDTKEFKAAKKRKVNLKKKTYFITSAQNATPVDKGLWDKMKKYAKHHKAEIVVIPLRYKNPTSVFTDKQKKNNWWDKEVVPYLMANRVKISNRFTILGDIKTQPTASQPLMSMEGLTLGESAIIGHTRMHFKTLPTLPKHSNKYLMTSGAITVPNYTDSKAGAKGSFNHIMGFTIIETDGKELLHVRQVSAEKSGDFCDLDYIVNAEGIEKSNRLIDALVGGDVHVGETCPVAHKSTLNQLKRFAPRNFIIHDISTGSSISHHERKNPFLAMEKLESGDYDMRKEFSAIFDYLEEVLEWNPVVVKSNHDVFYDRFLEDVNWHHTDNKKSFLKYSYLRSEGKLPNGIIPYEINQRFGDKVITLRDDSSFVVNGIELAMHGHIFASGGRPGKSSFSSLNFKLTTGHTHSPAILNNHFTVGTLTHLVLGYTKGASGWAHCNSLIHRSGKRQLILMEDGKYTNFK